METEEVARKDHLTKTEAGAECREEGYWGYAQTVDEEDGEEGVDETKLKDCDCQCANGEGGDYHVGGEPLSMDVSALHVLMGSANQDCPPLSRLS